MDNRTLVIQCMKDYPKIAAGDTELFNKYFHDDFVNHTELMHEKGASGKPALAEEAEKFSAGLFREGFETEIDVDVAEGDYVAAAWRLVGSHSGDAQYRQVGTLKASGDDLEFSGLVLFKVSDGQISEMWRYDNLTDVMAAKGAVQVTSA
jgi:predicted ester cyclase